MAKMKAEQVPKAGGEFEVVEREIPQPGPGHVRIKVQACGVCHSDADQGRRLAGHHVSARAGARSGGRD